MLNTDKIGLTANYHTHTKRCGHAWGEDAEYVEAAIKAGIKELGFADHTPYPTNTSFVSGMRMHLSDADGYFDSLTSLRDEYKKDIRILIGLETEYFPEHYGRLKEFLKDYPLDYMILGNHFLPQEENGIYVGAPFTDKAIIDEYVKNVITAVKTGDFAYVAHPDLPKYVGEDSVWVRTEAMSVICMEAARAGVPLEINVAGYARGAQYPSEEFFKMASKYNNQVIIGIDAHNPKEFERIKPVKECRELALKYNLMLIERLDL